MPEKRKPGRPPGHPRSGGRKKGTPNRNTAQTRERIMKEGDPIGYLLSIRNGKRQSAADPDNPKKNTWVYPSLEMKNDAAKFLAQRVSPIMKSVAIVGEDGDPFVFQFVNLPNA